MVSTARSCGIEVKRHVTSKETMTWLGRRLTHLRYSEHFVDELTLVFEVFGGEKIETSE